MFDCHNVGGTSDYEKMRQLGDGALHVVVRRNLKEVTLTDCNIPTRTP